MIESKRPSFQCWHRNRYAFTIPQQIAADHGDVAGAALALMRKSRFFGSVSGLSEIRYICIHRDGITHDSQYAPGLSPRHPLSNAEIEKLVNAGDYSWVQFTAKLGGQ